MKKKLKAILCIVAIGLIVFFLLTNCSGNVFNGVSKSIGDLTVVTPQEIEANKIVILKEMQDVARLDTAINNYQEIFRSERDVTRWFSWCGEWMTFVANGQVVAGIDLLKIKKTDIVINDGKLCINLPKPEIFYSFLNEEESYPDSHTWGPFSNVDPLTESTIRREAVVYFKDYALKNKILEKAYLNAINPLKSLIIDLEKQKLTTIKFKEVTFVQKK